MDIEQIKLAYHSHGMHQLPSKITTQLFVPTYLTALSQDLKHPVVLGRGKFGEVALSKCTTDELYYAVKVVPKDVIWQRKGKDQMRSELEMLQLIAEEGHPFICHFFGGWQTAGAVYMCFEYLYGGELFNLLRHKRKLTETMARFYTSEIALALSFLHENLVVAYR